MTRPREHLTRALPLLIALAGAIWGFSVRSVLLGPIVDTGRDIYLAERILEGARLYIDYRYNYPPLAPHLLAGFVALFGRTLDSFAIAGAAIAFACALLLERAVRALATSHIALACESIFVVVHVLSLSGLNFVFPYSYAATLGLLLLLACVLVLIRSSDQRIPWITVLLALAAALTKIEYGAAAVAAVLAAAPRFTWRALAPGVLAGSLMLAAYTSLDAMMIDAGVPAEETLLGSLAGPMATSEASKRYRAAVMSVGGAEHVLTAALLAALPGIAVLLLGYALRQRGTRTRWTVLSVSVVFLMAALWRYDLLYRSAVFLSPLYLYLAFRRGDVALRVCIAVFAVTLLRLGINVQPSWLGFTLAVPSLLVTARAWGVTIPRAGWVPADTPRWVALVFAGVLVNAAVLRPVPVRLEGTRVSTPRGSFLTGDPELASSIEALIGSVSRHGPNTLLVVPEGVLLNFVTGVRTPCRYYMFLPLETASMEVEQKMLSCLKERPPEMIVLMARDMGLFGEGDFGVGYNRVLWQWIDENYGLVATYPSHDSGKVIAREYHLNSWMR